MKSNIKTTNGERVFQVFNVIFMTGLILVTLYPFWYVLILSLNDGHNSRAGGLALVVRKFTWTNYMVILNDPAIVRGFLVSVARTVVGTSAAVLATALFSYVLAQKHLIGRRLITALITFTMFFGAGIIPVYMLMRDLHLTNNFLVYVLPALTSAFMILITRTYFESNIPPSVQESAMIDGANELQIFFKIIFPVSAPILATVALFVAVGHWNDWFAGYIYMTKPDLVPLQTLLVQIINQAAATSMMSAIQGASGGVDSGPTIESVRSATMVVAIVPIVIVYPFLQRYFVKGILVGSVKE